MEAVIYIAHGSRRELANQKYITFINEVIKQSSFEIQGFGFLEHAEPSIPQAIEACIQKGADRITVVPVLLSPGVHANVDIPGEIRNAEKLYPGMQYCYRATLGSDEAMVTILRERLTSQGFGNVTDEAVLLVGHGSREPEAAIELEKLANLLGKEINLEVHTGNLTTSDFYHEKVEELLTRPYKKIYLLPFLLFTGGFTVRMEKVLKKVKDKVIICEPIGFDDKLIPLIIKRANLG